MKTQSKEWDEIVPLVQRIVNRWIFRSGYQISTTEKDDLCQSALLRLLESGWTPDSKIVPWKSISGTCATIMSREWKRKKVEQEALKRRASEKRSSELSNLESSELRKSSSDKLLLQDPSGHDLVVFLLWLDGEDTITISSTCPWLSCAESAEKALVRIIQSLREENIDAPISVRRWNRRTDQLNGYRSHYDYLAYQRQYYQRKKCKEYLLSSGYNISGEGADGKSTYYVHPCGHKVRVSDHPPSNSNCYWIDITCKNIDLNAVDADRQKYQQ